MAERGETEIHPSAIVEEGAQIGQGCRIGPFCHIGPEVRLGDGVELKSHVVVSGETTVGEDCMIFPFACIGEIPQDLKFKGEKTRLEIGARNRIREHVTMNAGTEGGGVLAGCIRSGAVANGVGAVACTQRAQAIQITRSTSSYFVTAEGAISIGDDDGVSVLRAIGKIGNGDFRCCLAKHELIVAGCRRAGTQRRGGSAAGVGCITQSKGASSAGICKISY